MRNDEIDAWKSQKVTIERDDTSAMFCGQGCEMSVTHAVSRDPSFID